MDIYPTDCDRRGLCPRGESTIGLLRWVERLLYLQSPWWLVRHGRMDEAAVVVRRLMSKKEREDETNVTNTVANMKLTNEHEKALSAGTTYFDCFKGIDLRRTEVACLTWACQNMCGR